jgi:hypothetical protein
MKEIEGTSVDVSRDYKAGSEADQRDPPMAGTQGRSEAL